MSYTRTLLAVTVAEVLRTVKRKCTVSLLFALVELEKALLLERFLTSFVRLMEGFPGTTTQPPMARVTPTVAVSETKPVLLAFAWAVLTKVFKPQLKLPSPARLPVSRMVWLEPAAMLPRFVTVLPEIRVKFAGKLSVTITLFAVPVPLEVTTTWNWI